MKSAAIILAFSLVLLVAGTLIPGAEPFGFELHIAALVAAIALLPLVIWIVREPGERASLPAASAPPPPAASPTTACDDQVVVLLALLQERGRLIDFLMDDITAYGDDQVGAAARVVHEGCREVLGENFTVVPMREEAEGSEVTVPVGYAADEYRLVGTINGQAPFTGRLVHRGWRTTRVKMPRLAKTAGDRLPAIAPAEVQL